MTGYNTKFSGLANKEMYGHQLGELGVKGLNVLATARVCTEGIIVLCKRFAPSFSSGRTLDTCNIPKVFDTFILNVLLKKFSLNFSSLSFANRVNPRHP